MPEYGEPRRVSASSLNVTASGGFYNTTVSPVRCSRRPRWPRHVRSGPGSIMPGTAATLTVRTTAPTPAVTVLQRRFWTVVRTLSAAHWARCLQDWPENAEGKINDRGAGRHAIYRPGFSNRLRWQQHNNFWQPGHSEGKVHDHRHCHVCDGLLKAFHSDDAHRAARLKRNSPASEHTRTNASSSHRFFLKCAPFRGKSRNWKSARQTGRCCRRGRNRGALHVSVG
jgi:hypothetical protein